jgi:ABC-2 type transport system ATP-binding protein
MLSAAHLTRRFGACVAVDDVSFDVGAGQIFALLGPNGAGKTTTLRMLAGLIAPTSGAVRLDGEDVTPTALGRLRGQVGFLTEAPGLWDRLSVFQNLLVHAKLQGVVDPCRTVTDALAHFGLTARAQDLGAQLSKGLKQRVAIARTLLHRPAVVLLDEPTSGLDPESARDVRDLILGLRDEGRAVLVSTHNLDEADRVADRVAVLRTRLVALGTAETLRSTIFGVRLRLVLTGPAEPFRAALQGPGISDIRIEGAAISLEVDDPTRRTPDIVKALVLAGAQVQLVAPDEPSLEEVYLKLVQDRTARPPSS